MDLAQTKADLTCVIQDKHVLEERLQKSMDYAKALQTVRGFEIVKIMFSIVINCLYMTPCDEQINNLKTFFHYRNKMIYLENVKEKIEKYLC